MTGMCKEIFGRSGRMGECGSLSQDLPVIINQITVLSWYYINCIYSEKPSDKTQPKKPKKPPTIPFPWLCNITPPQLEKYLSVTQPFKV